MKSLQTTGTNMTNHQKTFPERNREEHSSGRRGNRGTNKGTQEKNRISGKPRGQKASAKQ